MARLIEPRDSEEVTVTVRHRCPAFAFGSALGPRNLTSWWWSSAARDHFDLFLDRDAVSIDVPAIEAAIYAELAGMPDYRRHLDELQERPE